MDLGPGMYVCFCAEGFSGENCEVLLNDPCADAPCQNDGTCTPDGGTEFTCECQDGFIGVECGIDIDDCAVNPCATFPCLNGGACERAAPNSPEYSCTCFPG